ncbi:hypothetical protein ACH5RR_003316 [Cinchona calisaya]|uniref:Uncharacterized protein n=1 Tax=Cinchona calisaya TaxID=153742 RepID=A0ABD3AUJ0_9GENT
MGSNCHLFIGTNVQGHATTFLPMQNRLMDGISNDQNSTLLKQPQGYVHVFDSCMDRDITMQHAHPPSAHELQAFSTSIGSRAKCTRHEKRSSGMLYVTLMQDFRTLGLGEAILMLLPYLRNTLAELLLTDDFI